MSKKPHKIDHKKLQKIASKVSEIQTIYSQLTSETKDFLQEEFITETFLDLRRFATNIDDAVKESQTI
ncbi:MAG TPA: hypothetical protein DCL77_14300 [Prolixibacteraceae bacterium]|jgi:archaellum component FlaC|nr:hypothetical protein [Prolixibacteraceae bacterium]